MYNENRLRGKIAEARLTIAELAAKIGKNATTLHKKLAGKVEFTRAEIQSLASVLHLSEDEIMEIFFA